LLENAVTIAPNNPNALFYSGIAAAERGDEHLAADRWEVLVGLNAPPEIQALLQEKVDLWRGTKAATNATVDGSPHNIVVIELSVSPAAGAVLPTEATVFVIARDPQQPSPPIAVTRRQLSELPTVVTLTDRDSMVPGRSLSAFQSFELVARVSISGQPMPQPGDWSGSMVYTVQSSDQDTVDLVIDQELP
jgi:cytochrome c-type biogenesis protein CcmH